MSDTPATTAAPAGLPAGLAAAVAAQQAAPKKLNAIQIVEQEIGNFIRQREQAIANVHAVEGAIQAAQRLLKLLQDEAAKAEAEAKKLLTEAKTEVVKVEGEVVTEVGKAVAAVEAEAKKL
jgi:hypothetical protein